MVPTVRVDIRRHDTKTIVLACPCHLEQTFERAPITMQGTNTATTFMPFRMRIITPLSLATRPYSTTMPLP